MGRSASDRAESPARGRGSPRRKSPSRREQSPVRHRSSRKDRSPAREKLSSRARSPKHEKSRSPVARSPLPRAKRLRRAQVEREAERATDRGSAKNHGKGDDRGSHREKGIDRENGSGRKEKRSGREEIDYKSSRSRGGHSLSPSNHGKGDDQGSHREKDTDRDNGSGRKEKRSGREEIDYKSSRSRGGRSPSPSDRHHRSRPKSRSPQGAAETRERDEDRNSRGANDQDDEDNSLAKMKAAEEALAAKKKQQPSFELSGKLAAETNKVRGITLLFTEPPEARKPDTRWRLYVFKGGEMLNEPFYIHRQSCYLFGRERRVADIPTDHPSCSKQHAVIQFRQVEKEQPDGTLTKQVRPYIMDLGSTNKTFINDSPVEPQRYYELFEKDTIKFGNSSREYVLLHENSAT